MAKKAATTHRRRDGVVISAVAAETMAAECGLEPGDTILTINGVAIPDSLSYTFNIAAPDLVLEVLKPGGELWELEIDNDPDTRFGASLEDDPIMLCRNKCIFCFVDQNPKGYRKSLLIKDEDVRLSFMFGNYTTLSSTDATEEERIIRERISPLYVSVHATDPEVRIFMLKSKKSGDITERLARFAAGAIDFHTQIVLCPGINDGHVLERSYRELAALHPRCQSIAVVPLGLTKWRQKLVELTAVTDAYCTEIIAQCETWRQRFQAELGYPLIFLGDEFYIRSGQPLPQADYYRDFPQMENGIGMVRRFLDSFKDNLARAQVPCATSGTIVTGTLFGPALTECIEQVNQKCGTQLRVVAILNESFGADHINVAGLIHGQDILDQVGRGKELGDFLLLPHVMLKDPVEDPLLIDDYTPIQLSRQLSVPIVGCPNSAEQLLEVLANWEDYILTSKDNAFTMVV